MRQLTSHVQRSSEEQSEVSRQIIRSTESIYEMIKQLRDAQSRQTAGSEKALAAVSAISEVARPQGELVRELEDAIRLLQQHAESLQGEMSRFRV